MRIFYQEQSDEALMIRMAEGDQKAFGILYERYWNKLCRFVRHYMNCSSETAQDVTQNVFLKIIKSSGKYNPGQKFSTWIFTITVNTCKNEFRKEQQQRLYVETSEALQIGSAMPSSLEASEFSEALQKALQTLEEPHRLAFALRIQEELPVAEVAKILECPEGTVKSRVFYALKKLSQLLTEFNPQAI